MKLGLPAATGAIGSAALTGSDVTTLRASAPAAMAVVRSEFDILKFLPLCVGGEFGTPSIRRPRRCEFLNLE